LGFSGTSLAANHRLACHSELSSTGGLTLVLVGHNFCSRNLRAGGCSASRGLLLAEVSVRIVVVHCVAHLAASRDLVIGHQWVRNSLSHDALAEGTRLRAKHIFVACNITYLIRATLIIGESSQPFCVSLRTTHILSVQVTVASAGVRQSLGSVAIDFAVGVVQVGLLNLEEITLVDAVTHGVLGLEWVGAALGLPRLSVDFVVTKRVVGLGTSVGNTVTSSLNI